MADTREIIVNGLWKNNPGLVQLLGLCPMLAVSNTVVNALGMSLATIFVMVVSGACVAAIRHVVRPEIRLPAFVMIIAASVTTAELLMQAFAYELSQSLGIFIALITTNCVIIGRAEAFAAKNTVADSALDGLMMALGFSAVLIALGGMREVLADGTLMAGADVIFGEAGKTLEIVIIEDFRGFLLAALPPGAFIGLGLLIAIKNIIDKGLAEREAQKASAVSTAEV